MIAVSFFLPFSFLNLYVQNNFTALNVLERMLTEVFGHVPELIYLLPTACFALNKIICFCNILPFLFVFHFHNYFFPARLATRDALQARSEALLSLMTDAF